jgi:hypothetical protein
MESSALRYFRIGMYALGILLALITIVNPTGTGFIATAILLGVAVVAALGFAVMAFIQNPKSAIKTLIGLGIVVVLFFIGKSITPAEPVYNVIGEKLADTNVALYAGASVFTGMVMMLLTFLVFIISEVVSFFR